LLQSYGHGVLEARKNFGEKNKEKLLEDFRLGWLDFELAADPLLSKDIKC
jgi:hypothetical protein